MFKRKKTAIDPNLTDTLIGEGSEFKGNIKSEASIRIEGKINGDIECKGDVTVGDQGNATSSIAARNVVIAGVVRGNITTEEKLTITATGKLYGNTTCKTLSIEDGGLFMGNSKMEGEASSNTEAEGQSDNNASSGFNRNYDDTAVNL